MSEHANTGTNVGTITGGRRPVDVFVAREGNGFMRDIAAWIVEAATELGRPARLVDDRLPADDGHTNLVVAPHEFYLLRDDPDARIREAARHSVPICTEQPGTPWFLLSLGFCVGSPLVADINAVGLAAIEEQGFHARRFRLGGVPSLDHSGVDRDIDVLFLGGHTDRRAAVLAGLGPHLWDRHAELRMFSTARPIRGDEAGIVLGSDKYRLLARSKVLVNLHRDDGDHGYFEWARMVEAMANGCVVVTEPSLGHDPLVAGEHFVETDAAGLADTLLALLDDVERREAIAANAHRAVQVDHPLAASVADLLTAAEGGGSSPVTVRERFGQLRTRWRARRPIEREHRPPLLPAFTPHRDLRRRAYRALVAEMDLRREIGHLRALLERDGDVTAERTETAAYAASSGADTHGVPEVSVVVTVHNYAHLVTETLDSIAASRDVDLEIVIVDDASADDGVAVVRTWLEAHPDVAAVLVASPVNRGLPETRNAAFDIARADKVMVMDADNLVYPTALRRLADALDSHPDAAFAYATLEDFGARPGLRSAWGWHVPWLCDANYIDAQAMLRRSTWERHGGYRDYEGTHGWEDWDLWLRIAAAGEHGVHVPQILGRYRTQPASMVAITNLAADDLRADLVARYPGLPWPELAGSAP